MIDQRAQHLLSHCNILQCCSQRRASVLPLPEDCTSCRLASEPAQMHAANVASSSAEDAFGAAIPQVYALLPPAADNLAAFAAWASTARHLPVLLAEHARGALRVEVSAGATLLIPGV